MSNIPPTMRGESRGGCIPVIVSEAKQSRVGADLSCADKLVGRVPMEPDNHHVP
jgi:hypothetical protein